MGNRICLLFLLLFYANLAHGKTPISVVTEVSSLAYVEKGKVVGLATQLMHEVMDEAGFSYELRILPWKRAYLEAQTDSHTLIYALSRTTEREDKFHWVGKIIPLNYQFYRLTSRPEIKGNSLDELKRYRVTTSRDGVIASFLQRHEFSQIAYVGGLEQEMKLMEAGRADLIILSGNSLQHILKLTQMSSNMLQSVFDISEISSASYMAFSKNTPLAVVVKAQAAYQRVVDDGRYMEIMRSRLETE